MSDKRLPDGWTLTQESFGFVLKDPAGATLGVYAERDMAVDEAILIAGDED